MGEILFTVSISSAAFRPERTLTIFYLTWNHCSSSSHFRQHISIKGYALGEQLLTGDCLWYSQPENGSNIKKAKSFCNAVYKPCVTFPPGLFGPPICQEIAPDSLCSGSEGTAE